MEKNYEIGYLLSPLIPTDEVAAKVAEAIKEPINTLKGVVGSELDPRHIVLAYRVGKTENHKRTSFGEAHFGAIRFTLAPESLLEFTDKLKANDLIIRFIMVSLPKNAAAMTPLKRLPAKRRLPNESRPIANEGDKPEKKPEMTKEAIDKEIEGLLVETA